MKIPKFFKKKLPVIALTIISLTACGTPLEPYGSIDPTNEFKKYRYKADAAVRLLKAEFDSGDATYLRGNLLYNDVYAEVNSITKSIIMQLEADASVEGFEDELQENMESAIESAIEFDEFIKLEVCLKAEQKDPNARLQTPCDQVGSSNIQAILGALPLAEIVTAISSYIDSARKEREKRRRELICEFRTLELLPFDAVGAGENGQSLEPDYLRASCEIDTSSELK